MAVHPEPSTNPRELEADELGAELDKIIERHADPWRVLHDQREAHIHEFLNGKEPA